jgi:hypothetical protein
LGYLEIWNDGWDGWPSARLLLWHLTLTPVGCADIVTHNFLRYTFLDVFSSRFKASFAGLKLKSEGTPNADDVAEAAKGLVLIQMNLI